MPPPTCLPLSIAGLRVDLDLTQAALSSTTLGTYAAFLDSASPPTATITLLRAPAERFREPTRATWEISARRDGPRLEFASYDETGEFDFNTRRGTLTLAGRGDPENFMRVLYAHLVLEAGGLLLHAAGIIRRDRGYVFFGPSTAGKTTTTRLSAGDTVLSDDMVLTRPVDGRYVLYGVPFRGDLPEAPRANAQAPLVGLYALYKSEEVHLDPLSPARALAELVSVVPFVMQDAATRARVTSRLLDLIACVPPQALYFRRDPSFWELIES